MKQFLIVVFTVVLASLLRGQVTIQNNIPSVIEPGAEVIVQVTLNKGAISGFARYQMDVPEGITISEDDSKGGTFAFENSHAKIFWTEVPSNIEVIITMKLTVSSFYGNTKITQKFYYMEDGTKKEMDADPIAVTFKPDNKNTAVSTLQAEQLKRDSKDAYQTGLKEQQAADKKIAEADEAIKKAGAIQDEKEKKAIVEKATAQKQKAENDKSVASKILALAKSLDDNASEIQQLNKASTSGASNSSSPASFLNGVAYRLQLGAFSQNPAKALYKHMGLIDIANEDGMYKVLMGKYSSKEEAIKKRSELVARSFDCFVVAYKDGVRVK